ncbi:MAG TPA: hypothetical protein VFT04_12730, partial [Gemmatimonadales bacterium]|nr:hypothetical protein [Gemmatimonadales bacterium]
YTASIHLPTDPLVLQRMYASSTLTPRIERVAPVVRLGFDGRRSRHHLMAGTSRIDDWHRHELAGIEVPVRSDLAHVSAAGTVAASGFDIGYRAGYDRSRIASHPGATAPPLDFTWRVFRGTLEASPRGGERRLGVRVIHRSGSSDSVRPPGRHVELGAFGELTVRTSAVLRHHVAATLSGRGDGMEGGAIVTNDLAVGGGHIVLRLAASRTRAMTPGGLIELAALGEPWLGTAGISAELPPPDQMVRMAGAEIGWTGRIGLRTSFSMSAYLRSFDGSLALRRDLDWDPVYRAWRGPVLVQETTGRTAGARFGLRHPASRTLDVSANVDIAKGYGDVSFRQAMAAAPTLRAIGAATWRPVASFGLRSELDLESARRWPDYGRAEAAPGKARSIQPAGIELSLTGWKTFLDGRLRAQFVARNLTARRIILHPEGRASTLSFLFLLGAAF